MLLLLANPQQLAHWERFLNIILLKSALLLGCLFHSPVMKWARFFLLTQIALLRVQRVRKI